MVITISPTHSSNSSHTGALPAGGKGRIQKAKEWHCSPENRTIQGGDSTYRQASYSPRGKFAQLKGRVPHPTSGTHVVRAAGAAGNDYPQPQRTEQFRGTQGALDHDLSQAERPRDLSLQCHGPFT